MTARNRPASGRRRPDDPARKIPPGRSRAEGPARKVPGDPIRRPTGSVMIQEAAEVAGIGHGVAAEVVVEVGMDPQALVQEAPDTPGLA